MTKKAEKTDTTERTMKASEYLRCEFTQEEIETFGTDMARAVERRTALEMKKKEVADAIKSDLSREDSLIQSLAQKITKRFEFRNVDCLVTYNTPKSGEKTVTRLDTGGVVETVKMNDGEMQEHLKLDADAA